MTLAAIGVGATAGAVAGVVLWQWLRTGTYRVEEDTPRMTLHRSWLAVPGATLLGGLAGGMNEPWVGAAAWIYLVGAVALIWIDLDVHRVPDRYLRWWAPILLGAVTIAAGAGSTHGWATLGTALAGAGAMALLFLILAIVGSMGLGDVKLAAVTGLMLGTFGGSAVIVGSVAAFAVGAAAGIVLMLRGAHRTSHVAFGPAIIIGATAAIAQAGL